MGGILGIMKADIKRKILRRLSLVRGQIEGVRKMVDEERYCIDIITQSSAIREALLGIERLMLENHLSTHVIEQIKSGKGKKATAEVLKIYQLGQQR